MMMQTKKSIPAKLPSQDTTHDIRTCFQLTRRVRKAVVMNWWESGCQCIADASMRLNWNIRRQNAMLRREEPLVVIDSHPSQPLVTLNPALGKMPTPCQDVPSMV